MDKKNIGYTMLDNAFVAIDDPTNAIKDVERISRPARAHNRSYRGFNLFYVDDLDLFRIITRGEFTISGLRNSELRNHLPGKISRIIKRLRKHSLIKKVRRCYKYYLTAPGRRITATALKLRAMFEGGKSPFEGGSRGCRGPTS